jgi:hypothetical protein
MPFCAACEGPSELASWQLTCPSLVAVIERWAHQDRHQSSICGPLCRPENEGSAEPSSGYLRGPRCCLARLGEPQSRRTDRVPAVLSHPATPCFRQASSSLFMVLFGPLSPRLGRANTEAVVGWTPGYPRPLLRIRILRLTFPSDQQFRPRKPRGERSYGDTFCSVTSPGHPDKQATMAAAFPDTLRRTFENSNSQVGILVALPRTARRRQNASIARRWSRAFPHQGRSRSTCAGKKHCQKAAAPMLVRRLGLIVEPDLTALALRAVKQAFWPNQQIGAPSTARLACRELRVGQ